MRELYYKRIVAWVLIAALLNLLPIMAPGGGVFTASQEHSHMTLTQLPAIEDSSPCHGNEPPMLDIVDAETDCCADYECDGSCFSCFQFGAAVLGRPMAGACSPPDGLVVAGPVGLSESDNELLPPPPKSVST